jgi:hypothetical protein
MKNFLKEIGVLLLMVLLLSNGIAYLSLKFHQRANFYKPSFVSNFKGDKNFDYVVLGSSTGLTTLNTQEIDSLSGKKGLNISMDDSALSSHYLMMKHFISEGLQTKILVLAVTPWDLETEAPTINDNDYRFLPFVYNNYVCDYFTEMSHGKPSVLSLTRYMPIVGVSYFNTELFYPSFIALLKPNYRNRFDTFGNYSYPTSGEKTLKKEKTSVVSIKISNPYYYRIVDFCRKNKIKLCLYQSPLSNSKVIYPKDILIINHSTLIQDNSLFYDDIHVNSKGRQVCSKKFVKDCLKSHVWEN